MSHDAFQSFKSVQGRQRPVFRPRTSPAPPPSTPQHQRSNEDEHRRGQDACFASRSRASFARPIFPVTRGIPPTPHLHHYRVRFITMANVSFPSFGPHD